MAMYTLCECLKRNYKMPMHPPVEEITLNASGLYISV